MVMADKGVKLRIAFAYLEDIKNLFFKQYPEKVRNSAIAYALNEEFSKVKLPTVMFIRSKRLD